MDKTMGRGCMISIRCRVVYSESPAQWCFRDDGGFSTEGMVVALLLACSLLFATTWVARAQIASSSIQASADAAALAAENEVADFMIAIRVADATLLSLSLFSVVLLAAGTILSCVPVASEVGATLIDTAGKVIEKRMTLADKFVSGLNGAQKGLVAAAQLQAQSIFQANSSDERHISGVVDLVPEEGEEISIGKGGNLKEAFDKTQTNAADVKEKSEEVEKAYEDAHKAYEDAWRADCGNIPSSCMYERASKLSTIPAAKNPMYHSPDTWSFSVALERARAYYAARLAAEAPLDSSIQEQTRSVLRKVMYNYALDELKGARAVEEDGVMPDIYFPLFPKNTSEMTKTHIYTDDLFYVSSGSTKYIHAHSGCPQLVSDGIGGMSSLSALDAGELKECPRCHFTSSDLGKVMAASSSIENGFEYYYRQVAQSANDYQKAMEKAIPLENGVKDIVEGIFDDLMEVLSSAFSDRIQAYPPGRFGALSVTYAHVDGKDFPFIQAPQSLGSFTAISAAGLVEDSQTNMFSNLLDGITNELDGSILTSVSILPQAWGALLHAYLEGTNGIQNAIESVLNNFPLISSANLGTWAASKFEEMLSEAGFAPVNTAPPKPVLVNSRHVLEYDDGKISSVINALKEAG